MYMCTTGGCVFLPHFSFSYLTLFSLFWPFSLLPSLLSLSPSLPPSPPPSPLSPLLPLSLRLFLEKLPKKHPDYSKPEYKQDRSKIKKLLKEAFPRAEELKKKLTIQFEAEKEALEKKLAEEVMADTHITSQSTVHDGRGGMIT